MKSLPASKSISKKTSDKKTIIEEMDRLMGSKISSKIPRLDIPAERNSRTIASVDSGKGSTALPPQQNYTGDKVIGIAVMHKSNAVPIFNDEAAIDVAKMRR